MNDTSTLEIVRRDIIQETAGLKKNLLNYAMESIKE